MKILITGSAGFIGYHLIKRLSSIKENEIFGIDNINAYYDKSLKLDRINNIERLPNVHFKEMDITNKDCLFHFFSQEKFEIVVNLAAQAGVRYSIENPRAYIDANINGFLNVLEACREYPVKHLLYASSSSVYGGNTKVPFSTEDNVDHPVSLYAATKKSNELMAHTYSHLYSIPTTGLRFFTVYGPYGRPDMAYYSFTKNIFEHKPIKLYNHGEMLRDFTYIDDVVEGICRLIDLPPKKNDNWNLQNITSESWAPYKIYNIGNNSPVSLLEFIETIENHTGILAKKEFVGMQKGDVIKTYADVNDLEKKIGFKPHTSLDDGIKKFVKWYKEYYKI
ncbi:NAD-dependent epimerase [Enterococcus casseliflavus]|uniref:NAD-dependent epimerase n=1 Tax=Enterococcus casseliflavus TaxID=37734 RepID=UPI0011583197|nr:NAD-dependent epimerase [Enterococcus casseliflavus]